MAADSSRIPVLEYEEGTPTPPSAPNNCAQVLVGSIVCIDVLVKGSLRFKQKRRPRGDSRTDSYYDSPPQNRRNYSTNVSWLVDTREDATKKPSSHDFMFSKEALSNDDVGGGQGATPYFRRYGLELVS